jgi:branched-chain amino acid transport system ATP-binding protein
MLARELSYGDQRLLEIAIALATVPRLLLLDEPTSGLSQEETQKIAGLIRRLARQYTVVMIEHKVDVVMTISDRITVMNFGEVIAEGSPAEITANERVKKAYFGT